MRQSLRLGTVAGIPVDVHWTVAVVLVIITDSLGASVLPVTLPHQPAITYWSVAAAASLVFLCSLLVHELAHALVARRNGVSVRSITLWMLGGMTELDGEPQSAGADLRIALAGPAASLAEAAAFGGLALIAGYSGAAPVATAATAWLAVMNGLIAAFNMLPGAPLDGGRVLRAALWRRYRDETRAALAAARAGRYLGAVIIAAGVAELLVWLRLDGIWLVVIGWFLVSAATTEERVAIATSALAGLRVADVMTTGVPVVAVWNTVQDVASLTAIHSPLGAFPVLSSGGGLAGVVLTSQLARIRPERRLALRVDEIMLSVPPGYVAAPRDPAGPLLTRAPLGGEVAAVVVEHGRVVGLVTGRGLGQAVRRAMQRSAPRRGRAGEPSDADERSGPADGLNAQNHAVLLAGCGKGPAGPGPWALVTPMRQRWSGRGRVEVPNACSHYLRVDVRQHAHDCRRHRQGPGARDPGHHGSGHRRERRTP
jgi:Zn-dependent protease